MVEPPTERFICNVKSIRKARGLSQSQLAKLAGVQRQAIYDLESGRYMPNTSVALRLAKHLDCKVEDLFASRRTRPHPAHNSGRRSCAGRFAPFLGRVRDRLVGFPLDGKEMLNDTLQAADGFLNPESGRIRPLSERDTPGSDRFAPWLRSSLFHTECPYWALCSRSTSHLQVFIQLSSSAKRRRQRCCNIGGKSSMRVVSMRTLQHQQA